MGITDQYIEQIRKLCHYHHVARLFLFGSALTNCFNDNSDVDFVVDFNEIDIYTYADNYFSLKEALEKLLKRQIDLLEEKAIRNPYLKQSIDVNKKLIYEH